MATRKPGWTYLYSEELAMEIAFNQSTGWVFCADGVRYSPTELQLLAAQHVPISLETHLIKKVMQGEVCEVNGQSTEILFLQDSLNER